MWKTLKSEDEDAASQLTTRFLPSARFIRNSERLREQGFLFGATENHICPLEVPWGTEFR